MTDLWYKSAPPNVTKVPHHKGDESALCYRSALMKLPKCLKAQKCPSLGYQSALQLQKCPFIVTKVPQNVTEVPFPLAPSLSLSCLSGIP